MGFGNFKYRTKAWWMAFGTNIPMGLPRGDYHLNRFVL
jgi:hypothetical protein